MNCKQAQRDIALWAGQDLDDAAQRDAVRQHVMSCFCCRTHYQRMKHTLHVLERAERPATYVTEDSLWPELAARINQPRHQPTAQWSTKRFTGWMPLVAMTAASFILLLVVIERPQQPGGTISRGVPAPAPVISVERPVSDPYAAFPEYQSREEQNPGGNPHESNLKLLNELRMRRLGEGF